MYQENIMRAYNKNSFFQFLFIFKAAVGGRIMHMIKMREVNKKDKKDLRKGKRANDESKKWNKNILEKGMPDERKHHTQ